MVTMALFSHSVQTLHNRVHDDPDKLFEKGMLLRAQYAELNALFVGVQEARTPYSMHRSLDWRVVASGAKDGHGGCAF